MDQASRSQIGLDVTLLQSRCTDDVGRVQATREQIVTSVGTNAIYHYNAIQTWKIDTTGRVTNAFG